MTDRSPLTGLWRRRLGTLAVTVTFAAAVVAGCYWAGVELHGSSKHYFEEQTPSTWTSVTLLVLCGLTCWRVRGELRAAGDPYAAFWTACSVSFVLAGLDDGLRIHEFLDKTGHSILSWDKDHPITDHADDAFVALYGLALLAIAWRHRRSIVRERALLATWGLGAAGFVAMVWADMRAWPMWREEGLKLVAAGFFLGGAINRARDGRAIASERSPSPAASLQPALSGARA